MSFEILGTTCSFSESWKNPLYDPYGNAIHPCFFSFVLLIINGLFTIPLVFKLIYLLYFNSFGPHRIKYSFGSAFKVKSVGVFSLIKLNSVFIQTLLTFVLLSFEFKSFLDVKSIAVAFNLLSIVLFVLPLHIVEQTRNLVPSSPLLGYWVVTSLVNFVILIQDIFSSYKIFIPDANPSVQSTVYVVEVLLFLNAIGILLLENNYYKPSEELVDYYQLNEWDYRAVRPLFTRLFFYYLNDLIVKAKKTDEVELTDLPPRIIDVENKVAYDKFRSYWDASVKKTDEANKRRLEKARKTGKPFVKKEPALFIPLVKTTKWFLLRAIFFSFLEFAVDAAHPFLLRRFLLFATNRYYLKMSSLEDGYKEEPIIVGFTMATLIYICDVLGILSFNRIFICTQTLSHVIETALSSHIYHKGMKLSPKARKNKTVGEIINNMAQDVSTITYGPEVIIDIVTQPVRFVVYMYSLYRFLGFASFAGLAAATVLIPLASACFGFEYKFYTVQMKYKDARAKLMSEILNSIKSIKLYSWESPMLDRLSEIRNNKELKTLRQLATLNSCIRFIWNSIPYSVAVSTFVCAAKFTNIRLTPDVVFPSLAIFELLTRPIIMLPAIFQNAAEVKASLNRLIKLFTLEELEIPEYDKNVRALKKGEEAIIIKNATFLWTKETDEERHVKTLANADQADQEANIESEAAEINPIALTDISFTATKGELACVVGRVGSGKTTLLRAILGCIPVDSQNYKPTLKVNGSIAYSSQNPWILNASVRENILFGRKYDKGFYQATIEACQLVKDFDILPDSDRTIVGEKGISLSGGQKARISLARAVYSRAEIYVLDDVLSAVDTHVGKQIIEKVLSKKGLLATKTIVLATNSVPVLHKADNIIFLKDGKITERGPFDEIMKTDSELTKLINEFGKKEDEDIDEVDSSPEQSPIPESRSDSSDSLLDEDEAKVYKPSAAADLKLTRVETNVTIAPSFVSFDHVYDNDYLEESLAVRKTGDTQEIQTRGKVNLWIYAKYLKACGYFYIALYMLFSVLSVLLGLSDSFILKHWSEENSKHLHNVQITFYLLLYSGVGIISLLSTLISALIIETVVAINGSIYFHDTMAKRVLRSPMSFFETTPVGRILNRFTEDINVIDNQLIHQVTMFATFSFKLISVFGVVVFNLPVMSIVLIALTFFYDSFRKLFIPCSRELKRLRSAQKSPVFSHLQESITGIDTIVAYDQLDRFVHKSLSNLNRLISVEETNVHCNRWLSMRLQNLSQIIVYCSSMLILSSLSSNKPLSPGMVGFMMTNILEVTFNINAIVRTFADIETKSITLERLVEYCGLKTEADLIVEDNRPPESWPSKGEIVFKDYETKYRANLDPVLSNISIDIKPKEKIGIVGRTGAGKSTLTLALFRIIESTKGHIEIDGVDTSKVGLFDLRSKLNIIPQDSQAFNGTVRQNLDPFNKHSDEELWKVLQLSHLKEHIESMKTESKVSNDDDDPDNEDQAVLEISTGLDATIDEGGSNLSAGQRQLLCLARALLNQSNVLILDEATASVDVQTDKIVQETIRSEFNDKTILTVAHRIETIMDSDRILVLDKGEVREFDSPENLLKNTDSIFYSLCKQGGHI